MKRLDPETIDYYNSEIVPMIAENTVTVKWMRFACSYPPKHMKCLKMRIAV